MDGANLNAILGRFKPGEAGFDVMHFNVHKTFSHAARRRRSGRRTGRGGGARCVPFLPDAARPARPTTALPARAGRASGRRRSAGCAASPGNTGVLVRAYAYLRRTAAAGLREVSDDAVLAANYLEAPPGGHVRHPVRPRRASTSSSRRRRRSRSATGVRTLDIAKRLIDYGFHPPTIYFPLIVDEGMLIEPTETESIETLDAFADALIAIVARGPDAIPSWSRRRRTRAPVRRLDEATAARQPNLRWRPMTGARDPVSGLTRRAGSTARAKRTFVRLRLTAHRGAVDSTGSAPT